MIEILFITMELMKNNLKIISIRVKIDKMVELHEYLNENFSL